MSKIERRATWSAARERAEAIVAAWNALDDWEKSVFAGFTDRQTRSAGMPIPAFGSMAAEAENWAAIASARELNAYVAAAAVRLGPADRADLAAHLGRLP